MSSEQPVGAPDETVVGYLERTDTSPPRFKQWKRDLLDLSLRNPLLNMPRNSRVLDLVVPSGQLAQVDDVVHAGGTIRLLPGVPTEEAPRTEAELVRAIGDAFWSEFARRRILYSFEPESIHRERLRRLKRDAETLEQETGSNYLYLTLGSLVHEKPNGGFARAPLFLLPVRLKGGGQHTSYSFSLEGDEIAQPNLCLLEWLKATKGITLDALENPALDDRGLAIGAIFEGIRAALREAEAPYVLEDTVSLAILKFSTFQIWKDLDQNWQQLMRSPVVEHLVVRPGETFDDPAGREPAPLDESALRLPIAADGSQMAAIVRAASGQSFVLEGPPGTGKSQTITNLIAYAIGAGKKVLFVAEKQAALQVVKRRLDAVGLGAFGLELHGAKQTMASIRNQLRTALDQVAHPDNNLWAMTDARYRSSTQALESHPAFVHTPNAAGHSVWTAYDAVSMLGAGPTATIPRSWLAVATDVSQLVRDYAAAAAQFGVRAGHPWSVAGVPAEGALTVEGASAALAELAAVRGELSLLSAPWALAVREVRPTAALEAVLALLDARGQGILPDPNALAAVDRPSWGESVTSLQEALAEYRSTHRIVLEGAHPEAFVAPDLADIEARSARLDEAFFFPEFRRRRLVERVRGLVRMPFESRDLTTLVRELRAAVAGADPVREAARAIPGLTLPAGWQPFAASAEVDLTRARHVCVTAVWASKHVPAAWAALPVTTAPDEAVLRSIDTAWRRWLAVIGGSTFTVERWAENDWITAWERSEAFWSRDVAETGVLQPQRHVETARLLDEIRAAGLEAFAWELGAVRIAPSDAAEAHLRGLATASLAERLASTGLDGFDSDAQDRATETYLQSAAGIRALLATAGPAGLLAQRPFDPANMRGEVAELARQVERRRGGLTFREITRLFPDALQSIVPVFLMSPGSVAHYLDPGFGFDLVIFDEASQVRVPQAIGAMGRGKAIVVVGDSKQMPPTRVMEVDASPDGPEDPLAVEDLESILSEVAESGLPRVLLEWHYRSRDESLIAFSNSRYYDGRLVSLPSPGADPGEGVEWRRIDGVFERGRRRVNVAEAEAIVDEISARLADPVTAQDSIGVVCFNLQQRHLILTMLEDSADPLVQAALVLPPGESLFVKNLENVQGDERDTILFSLAFSLDPKTGELPLNFGPLNLAGGERRLNVAITRARRNIVLFSSFDPSDIDLRRSRAQGIADLRSYLEFAASRAPIERESARATMSNRGRLVEEIAEALRAYGYEVQTELGLSSFKVDLAARRPSDDRWRVAVLVDGPGWSSRPTVADRDGSPALLTGLMGWRAVARVWLPGWIRDRVATLAHIRRLLEAPDVESAPVAEPEPVAEPASVAGPVEAPLPVVATPAPVTDFTPSPTTGVESQSLLNNFSRARAAVERLASDALAIEGPTHVDRLVRIVTARFGYTRVGAAKRDEILRVLGEVFLLDPDGFVWPVGLVAEQWMGIRRTLRTQDRAIDEISPREVGNAIAHVLRESFSATRDDLLRETAEVLGYDRMTGPVISWLARCLDAEVEAARITDDGARLRLAP